MPGLLEYFNVNIYSSSLLNDERLLSPLAKNGQKYYKYQIDSVMGDPNNLDYRVRFIPRTKSDQLVGGYMVVRFRWEMSARKMNSCRCVMM